MQIEVFVKQPDGNEGSESFLDVVELPTVPRIGESIRIYRDEGTFSLNGIPNTKGYYLRVIDVIYLTVKCTRGTFSRRESISCLCISA